MGKIIDGLLNYLSKTSQEQIEEDLKKLDKYKNVGPNVDDFLNRCNHLRKCKKFIKKK